MPVMGVWDVLGTVWAGLVTLLGGVAVLFGLATIALAWWATRFFHRRWREAMDMDRNWARATATIVGDTDMDLSTLGTLDGQSYSFTGPTGGT